MLFYGIEVKHTLQLDGLSMNSNNDLPFVPSHPFPFQLNYTDKPNNRSLPYPTINQANRVE
jgi:hypothetical protein